MYSLSEIILTSSPVYLKYFSRKTGFLITDFQGAFQNNVRWLWRHLSKKYNFEIQFSGLIPEEKKRFNEILLNSGYCPLNDEISERIENKIPWVFNHPVTGIFIPLEIIKLLMREDIFYRENYLFSLLYRLKIKEQKNFASLMGGTFEGQIKLSFEDNPLDMALVLYIWLMESIRKITDIRKIIPERGRIINGPFRFARESIVESAASAHELTSLLPEKPVPIWEYLYTHFSHVKEDVDKLYTLINRGNKGFYRSLALLKNQNSDLILSLKTGILIPVILHADRKSKIEKSARIKLVSPVELHHSLSSSSRQMPRTADK